MTGRTPSRCALALALAVLSGGAARAELTLTVARYACERGVEVPVAYVTAPDGASVAVLTVEGRQVALHQDVSGSGARYGWPSDGSNYVWWSKGDAATLSWKNGEDGTATPILSECRTAG